mgnify:CR=1 FL=1
MDKMLSVVLPAYNEEQMIKKTAQVVGDLLEKEQIPYELVFVNDGSKDHTWEKILELKEERAHIKGVCFSRNFGKEGAVFAGITQAEGDCIAVMDCDLQHPPGNTYKDVSFMGRRISGDRGSKSIQRKRKFHSQDVCKNILQYYQ